MLKKFFWGITDFTEGSFLIWSSDNSFQQGSPQGLSSFPAWADPWFGFMQVKSGQNVNDDMKSDLKPDA